MLILTHPWSNAFAACGSFYSCFPKLLPLGYCHVTNIEENMLIETLHFLNDYSFEMVYSKEKQAGMFEISMS